MEVGDKEWQKPTISRQIFACGRSGAVILTPDRLDTIFSGRSTSGSRRSILDSAPTSLSVTEVSRLYIRVKEVAVLIMMKSKIGPAQTETEGKEWKSALHGRR
ncbi:hypothetical protein B0H10DRAFT_1952579 [Mycena sp. CBHHK59/15]|nr:hypothetical protein B0H10DRAFT_1952579 [Mycena sp. CBHHK59/15]